MKAFFDTSLLVAAIVRSHPQHGQALPWLAQARSGEIQLLVARHSLAELYSVLSTLPIRPRIAPSIAWRLVQENVGAVANLIALSATDYLETLQRHTLRRLHDGRSDPDRGPGFALAGRGAAVRRRDRGRVAPGPELTDRLRLPFALYLFSRLDLFAPQPSTT